MSNGSEHRFFFSSHIRFFLACEEKKARKQKVRERAKREKSKKKRGKSEILLEFRFVRVKNPASKIFICEKFTASILSNYVKKIDISKPFCNNKLIVRFFFYMRESFKNSTNIFYARNVSEKRAILRAFKIWRGFLARVF